MDMPRNRFKPDDTERGQAARLRAYGWYSYAGCLCRRCGGELGPYQVGRGCDQELWGCPECGVGVFCSGEGQPTVDQAADIYAGLMR